MTEPDIFDDQEDAATPSEPVEGPKEEDNSDMVTLKCPGSMSELQHPDGAFPTVTRAGTKMTREQAKLAKAAAKRARKSLITVGGRNR